MIRSNGYYNGSKGDAGATAVSAERGKACCDVSGNIVELLTRGFWRGLRHCRIFTINFLSATWENEAAKIRHQAMKKTRHPPML
jgi:hypothetical protein